MHFFLFFLLDRCAHYHLSSVLWYWLVLMREENGLNFLVKLAEIDLSRVCIAFHPSGLVPTQSSLPFDPFPQSLGLDSFKTQTRYEIFLWALFNHTFLCYWVLKLTKLAYSDLSKVSIIPILREPLTLN